MRDSESDSLADTDGDFSCSGGRKVSFLEDFCAGEEEGERLSSPSDAELLSEGESEYDGDLEGLCSDSESLVEEALYSGRLWGGVLGENEWRTLHGKHLYGSVWVYVCTQMKDHSKCKFGSPR